MDADNDNLLPVHEQDARGEWQFLRCGPLTAYFDPETVALRRVCLGENEVVRAIYVAVRDHNWNTITPILADVDLTAQDEGFHLTFNVRHRERDIDFAWRGEIRGDAEGHIQFTMDGRALSTFRRNRIGFCVLHPTPACVGQPCLVQTTDGKMERGTFPDLISPHQPFQNIRSLSHEAAPGVWAEVAFEGDVFEMEDQRNWTDASYKTYCTPIALLYPVLVPAGTEIRQAITISLLAEEGTGMKREATGTKERTRLGGASRQTSFGREFRKDASGSPSASALQTEPEQTPVTLRFANAPPLSLPHIGLCVASHGQPLSERAIALLRELDLSHLRLDLTPSTPDWEAKLRQAGAEAQATGAELEVGLFLTDNAQAELTRITDALTALPCSIARWLIFHVGEKVTRTQWVQMARQALDPVSPGVPIGAGTNAYFAELNRERPDPDGLDFVSYSLNPQVHAFDDASLMENLQAQADTVRSAKAFCGDVPIVVSPVTFRPRFNPNATGNDAPSDPNELPFEVDTRQMSLLGAGWTLGSLKALCEAGVHSVTYYETTGWRGIMETETGSPLPDKFPFTPGEVFPMYHVFQDVGQFAGGIMQPLTSSDALRVVGIVLRTEQEKVILYANLTPITQPVHVIFPQNNIEYYVLWLIHAGNVNEQPIELEKRRGWKNGMVLHDHDGVLRWNLPPYAYARLEWGEEDPEQEGEDDA